jgi:hypothetical protein
MKDTSQASTAPSSGQFAVERNQEMIKENEGNSSSSSVDDDVA